MKVQYYDGISALPQPADIYLGQKELRIVLQENSKSVICAIDSVRIDESFGGKRRIYINDTEYFLDDGKATEAIRSLKPGVSTTLKFLIEKIEHHWPLVILSFFGLMIAGFVFVNKGMPFLSSKIAAMIPDNMSKTMGQQALNGLDQIKLTEASKVALADQERIRQKYYSICSKELPPEMCRLEFRHSSRGFLNYNAFAAPGGLSVLLDGMYELAANDQEILAILLHELGHQKNNHALQKLVESSIYTVSFAMFLGDVSSISGILTAAPAAIVQAQHSQAHETEADDWGLNIMQKHDISTIHFADIMQRLAEKFELCKASGCKDEEYSLINSHPGINSRIKKAQLLASR